MRACAGVLVVAVALAASGCGGDDDGSGSSGAPNAGGPCTPGMKSTMLVKTAMDPCPQDMCGDDTSVPGTDNDYVTIAECDPATNTWHKCGCQPKCGNGIRQAGEACEGSDLGGMTCMTMGRSGGVLRCTAQCVLDLQMCAAPGAPVGGAGG